MKQYAITRLMMVVATSVAFASAAHAFAPTIANTRTSQDSKTGEVTVTYTLTGDASVITADVQTNSAANAAWASIGAANYTGMTGDVWTVVEPDAAATRTIRWPKTAAGQAPLAFGRHVRVVLTAWSTNAPPDYLVVDLSDKTAKPQYYPEEILLPEGGSVTNAVYKDQYLVMKRIHAAGKTWMMSNDPVAKSQLRSEYRRATECPHPVVLSRDYYIGVYEITRAQYRRITGNEPGGGGTEHLPVRWLSYAGLRGSKTGILYPVFTDGKFDYEKSAQVDSGTPVAKLRTFPALGRADLPTEAQWEFAARGGDRGLIPNGYTYAQTNLAKVARCTANRNEVDCEGYTNTIATVGSYEPNVFGLYDMLGNIAEHVLDRWIDLSTCNNGGPISSTEVVVDYIGGTSGLEIDKQGNVSTNTLTCGSMWDYGYGYMYIGYQGMSYAQNISSPGYLGWRAAMTLR